ncbi:MAG TPA: inositol monophosphatase family protein [Pseudonocardia sp.]
MTALFVPPAEPVDPGLLSHAVEVAGRLATDAAEVISATAEGAAGGHPHPFDWVTDTGRTLERHTRRVLTAEFAGIPVSGPEYPGGRPAGCRYRWLVTPLDGTANYRAGLPWYGYGLALVDDAGPVVGVLADPSRATIYAAARGRGARANGVPVRVPERAVTHPFPVCVEASGGPHPPCRPAPEMRVLGSPALAVTQVALGHASAAVVERHQPWEVAAGLAVAVEAGAVVLDRDGRPDPSPVGALLVAAPWAVAEVFGWWTAVPPTG